MLGVEAVTTETGGSEKQAEVMCVDQSHWVTESTEMGGKSRLASPPKKLTFKIKLKMVKERIGRGLISK